MIAYRLDVFHRRCLRAILGISWRDHVTNEEVMRRAGTERLQDIVTTMRREMAVTVIDGDFSSPDAPRGTGGPKYTSKSWFAITMSLNSDPKETCAKT